MSKEEIKKRIDAMVAIGIIGVMVIALLRLLYSKVIEFLVSLATDGTAEAISIGIGVLLMLIALGIFLKTFAFDIWKSE